MALPASARYVTIRDALYNLLNTHANLNGIASWHKTLHSFQEIASLGQFPAAAIVYSPQMSEAAWHMSGNTKEYRYFLEVHVAVHSSVSPQTCQDSLLQHLEAIEDVLQGDPSWSDAIRLSWNQATRWGVGREETEKSYLATGSISLAALKRKT